MQEEVASLLLCSCPNRSPCTEAPPHLLLQGARLHRGGSRSTAAGGLLLQWLVPGPARKIVPSCILVLFRRMMGFLLWHPLRSASLRQFYLCTFENTGECIECLKMLGMCKARAKCLPRSVRGVCTACGLVPEESQVVILGTSSSVCLSILFKYMIDVYSVELYPSLLLGK